MENIEVIIIAVIIIAIVFKILKIIKYFIGILLLLFVFNLFGGFENSTVVKINDEYGISEKMSDLNEKIGLKGLISDLFTKAEKIKDGTVDDFICNEDSNMKKNISDKFQANHELLDGKENITCNKN
jgi:hypothetical protein